MKKMIVFFIIILSFSLFFVSNLSANQYENYSSSDETSHINADDNKNSSFVKILSVGSIVFGSFAMAGGAYIALCDSNKKKTK